MWIIIFDTKNSKPLPTRTFSELFSPIIDSVVPFKYHRQKPQWIWEP